MVEQNFKKNEETVEEVCVINAAWTQRHQYSISDHLGEINEFEIAKTLRKGGTQMTLTKKHNITFDDVSRIIATLAGGSIIGQSLAGIPGLVVGAIVGALAGYLYRA